MKGIVQPATSPTKAEAAKAFAVTAATPSSFLADFGLTHDLQRKPTGHWTRQLLQIGMLHSVHVRRVSVCEHSFGMRFRQSVDELPLRLIICTCCLFCCA